MADCLGLPERIKVLIPKNCPCRSLVHPYIAKMRDVFLSADGSYLNVVMEWPNMGSLLGHVTSFRELQQDQRMREDNARWVAVKSSTTKANATLSSILFSTSMTPTATGRQLCCEWAPLVGLKQHGVTWEGGFV